MEVEVRSVAGERNCFVKLPLHVIYALQSSTETLPPLLVLELRRPKDAKVWYIAWSGASSTTSCIEIPQRLAQCIGLGNSEKLILKIIPNVSEAQSIQVEPASEDDWEMMELNADYLEEHILNQVGVVQEGCQFPLWVQGQAALTIRAVSTTPRPVVKLVRGTELIIAPKIRENAKGAEAKVDSLEGKKMVGTWLRIQDLQKSVLKSYNLGTLMIKPYPTTVAFISPCTANRALLEDSQFVQLVSDAYTNTNGDTHFVNKEGSAEKADLSTSEAPSDWVIGHKAIVRLLIRDDVADGHIMLCRPLCQFIGARIHARIYVQSIGQEEGELPTSAMISPAVGKEVPSKQVIGIKNAQQTTEVAKRDYNYLDFEELFVMALNDCKEEIADLSRKREDFGNAALELLKTWIKLQSSIGDSKQFLLREKTIVAFSVQKQQSRKAVNIPIISDAVSFARRHHKDYLLVLDLASSKKVKQSTFVLSEDLFTSNHNKIALHLELDHPLFLPHILRNHINKKEAPLLESLSWLHPVSSQALTRLKVILSHAARESMAMLGTPTPGGLLLHGPPACGKTQFSLAVARELEDDPQTLAHCVTIRCTDFYGEQEQFIRKSLQDALAEAVTHAPSLVILDDLDVLIPATDSQGSDPPTSVAVLVEYLSDLMNAIQCHSGSYVAFLATAKGAEALPVSIRSSGRFDFYLALPAPAAKERAEMLGSAVTKRGLLCMESVVQRAASNCDGYDASDLDVLMDRVVHAAAARFLSASSRVDETETDLKQAMDQDTKHILPLMQKASFELVDEDFNAAFINFSPAAIRGISKNKTEETRRGWEDVGGLFDVQQALQEMLELPVKYGNLFSKSPLRLRTGVLLYGPPGCGKTHIVGAAAAAASLRFISVKGPELLNKYIGASEQAVRDIFSKAGAAAPCILFFDEFDAIAPKRGHDNTGVTDRVVNQFLTELDGVEALNGVFVFAATSRPDLLDAALLRPGRLDRLLYCGFPSRKDRLEILRVLSQQLPLADDVDFEYIAAHSEGFSGADLQALLSDAQLEAVHRCLELSQDKIAVPQASRTNPVITMSILNSTMLTTRPSVADSERQRLMNIYDEFLSGRNPGVAKTRDIKGKRATLA